ncbi:MAG: NAD(P)H-binding protein, partial [Chitinophagaceae bacterium]|nr:NAD(P)H-binding protein [Chitinophagaceae bacterium]
DEAMQGQEIVIEAMIPRDAEPTNFIAASTHNIIKAMHANRVWRLVILSEVGAAGSLHQGPLIYRLWMWLRQMKSGYSLTERTIREAFVQKSGLEWTIVRSVIIKSSSSFNGDPDISFSVKKTLRRPSIAGVSLAAFLLHTAVEHTFINKIIGISDK